MNAPGENRLPYPPMLVFAVAMTAGLLLALSIYMLSARIGIGIGSNWREVTATNANAVRAALGWWAVGGAGLAGSFLAALLMQARQPRRPHRGGSRWFIGIVFFVLLVGVPHFSRSDPASDVLVAFLSNIAAFALATLSAFCGSWFALGR